MKFEIPGNIFWNFKERKKSAPAGGALFVQREKIPFKICPTGPPPTFS